MLSLPRHAKVYLCVPPVDMRKSFNGLCGLVETVFERDVLDGHLFLFINKRRDRLKAMWWDTDGLAIWYKRLERGTFEVPSAGQKQQLELDGTELAMLLSGVALASVKRRKRYSPAG